FQTRGVRLQVHKLQRVGGGQIAVENFVLIVVEKLRQAGVRVDAKVFAALWADVEILFQVLLPDNLAAAVTLNPQPLGAHSLLARSVQLTRLSLEPSHRNSSQLPVASKTCPYWQLVAGNWQLVLDSSLRHH